MASLANFSNLTGGAARPANRTFEGLIPYQIGRRQGRQPTAIETTPGHQSDSALACSSAPHPSDPQPPNVTTKGEKTDIPTLLSADILALRLHPCFADPLLWNIGTGLRLCRS
jgi:hypothetical protein